jgi:hypothetical protein
MGYVSGLPGSGKRRALVTLPYQICQTARRIIVSRALHLTYFYFAHGKKSC